MSIPSLLWFIHSISMMIIIITRFFCGKTNHMGAFIDDDHNDNNFFEMKKIVIFFIRCCQLLLKNITYNYVLLVMLVFWCFRWNFFFQFSIVVVWLCLTRSPSGHHHHHQHRQWKIEKIFSLCSIVISFIYWLSPTSQPKKYSTLGYTTVLLLIFHHHHFFPLLSLL